MILKAKLGLERYPDPETFRDELEKYTEENIGQLFLVNKDLLHVLTLVAGPQAVDLHHDAKVINVYGDQEKAEERYNPHKNGRKSYLMKVCTIEPFGFIVAIHLESGGFGQRDRFSGGYGGLLPIFLTIKIQEVSLTFLTFPR